MKVHLYVPDFPERSAACTMHFTAGRGMNDATVFRTHAAIDIDIRNRTNVYMHPALAPWLTLTSVYFECS